MKFNKSFVLKRILPVVAGGVIGYAYYYFIGCASGTCAITSNPYISTAYGSVIGLIFAFPAKKKKSEVNNDRSKENN